MGRSRFLSFRLAGIEKIVEMRKMRRTDREACLYNRRERGMKTLCTYPIFSPPTRAILSDRIE
jgi:hypothetical protein